MDLYFKSHPSKMSAYIAPLAQHKNTKYAETFVKHFRPHATGICSKEEFEEFLRFASLHNHNILLVD